MPLIGSFRLVSYVEVDLKEPGHGLNLSREHYSEFLALQNTISGLSEQLLI
jgi:hypothetical protein